MTTVGLLEGLTGTVGDELTRLAGLHQTRLTALLLPEQRVQGDLNNASGTSGAAPIALSGTWTWNGTLTVLSTDTSGVGIGSMIRLDSDGQLFGIASIVANVSVTLTNPGSLTVPSGTDPTSRVDPTVVTISSGAFLAASGPGRRFRVLSGPLAGRTALINTRDSGTQLTLRKPIGSPPALFASESWEVVIDAEDEAQVESVLDWPASGRVSIDGIIYSYASRTTFFLQGLSYFNGELFVAGAARRHEALVIVTDLSESRSALEQVRQSILIEHATGENLNVIGRNLGALRPSPLLDDDVYRRLVQAIAYVAKGTELAIERALEALLGETSIQTGSEATGSGLVVTLNAGIFDASVERGMRFYLRSGVNAGQYTLVESRDSGSQLTLQSAVLGDFVNLDFEIASPNWEIFEDLTLGSFNHPCTVFLRRTDDDAEDPEGKAFLDGEELRPTTGAATVSLPATPIRVHGVRLASEPGQNGVRKIASGLSASGTPGANQTVAVTGPAVSFPARILPGDVFEILDGMLAGARATVASRASDTAITLGPIRNHPAYVVTEAFTNASWRIIRLTSSFRNVKPTAEVYEEYSGDAGTTEWVFAGTGGATEGANTTLIDHATLGQFLEVTIGAGETARYRHPLRIRPESNAEVSMLVAPGGTPDSGANDGLQWGFELRDGAKRLFVGLIYSGAGTIHNLGFVNTATGAFISGVLATIDTAGAGGFKNLRLRKMGRTRIELYVDARLAGALAYSDAGLQATADTEISFGCIDAANDTADFRVKEMDWSSETETDYWNVNIADGSLTTAEHLVDNTASGLFLSADVGKRVRILDFTAVNASSGNPLGEWEISSRISGDEVVLTGPRKRGGAFSVANLSRLVVRDGPGSFVWPNHRGCSVEILTGVNAGVYPILQILDPVALTHVETGLVRTATLSSTWTSAAAIQLVQRSNAVLLDTAGGSPARPSGFTLTDEEADWRLIPNFATDAGPVPYALVDAGTQAGAALTMRQNFPFGTGTVVAIQRTSVLSAQVLDDKDENIQVTPERDFHPFYLADRWGFVRDVIKRLTDAGILPDYDHLSRDAAGPHVSED